jgi:hypothetical protein
LRYRFVVSVPIPYRNCIIVYSDVDAKKEALIPSTPSSDTAKIAVIETHEFCCEPVRLLFSIKTSTKKASEWAEEYLRIWEKEQPSIRNITFAGRSAVEANGRGGYGPPYRLVVIPLSSSLLVIIQDMDDPLLSNALSTFKFTQ